ncbi:MAG TPA: cbb3-type cytochrome c oxidase subunit 3 [Burkholderiales bacterium]|nr:cbb3-type cytochrome c oxidase subunit 3 [Burkholderiales bacterium]
MDLNDFRIAVTVAAFLTFLGIVAWAYSARRRNDYDQAARMALDDDRPAMPKRSGK